MFGFLRLIRGICGLLFGMQIVGLLPVLTWLQNLGAVTGNIWAQVFFKILAMLLFGWLFFWLRNSINQQHTKKYGVPHPILADKKWVL